MTLMNLKRLADKDFGQGVGTVVCGWSVDDCNRLVDYHFADVVVLYTNVIDVPQALNLLGP